MSRITGFISRRGENPSVLLRKMLAASQTRPAWTAAQQITGRLGLGWTGWQTPNLAAVNGILVVLDGMIFNAHELGSAPSDAALLAALYQKFGFSKALQKINGDFALALFDSHKDTLWLARDRFGAKPLYYVSNPALFAFGSRPRALLLLPGVSSGANHRFAALFAASHYRTFDNDPDASAYADIQQLPAATALEFRNGQVRKEVYWSLQNEADLTGSEDDLAAQYRDLLKDAVALRLKAAKRPVFTLSGGMDSSSVLACSVQITGKKQQAVSTVYEDPTYDETQDIRSMLDSCVEQWHTVKIGLPDLIPVINRMISDNDEPVATATFLSHYLLCQEMHRKGFGSLFGGLGGDELNAGEYEYFFFNFADLRAAGREQELRHETEKWVEYHNHPIFTKNFQVMEDGLARMTDPSIPGRCLPDLKRMRRYFNTLNPEYFQVGDFSPVMDHPFQSYLKNRTFQDIYRETIPCCLRAGERNTTAWELDPFLPFFDHRLAEFMFRIPGSLKIRHGVTKYLLRLAMRGILPEETRTRIKKTGWNAPAHVWFMGSGLDLVSDLVHSRQFRKRGIYIVSEVEKLIEEHAQIVANKKLQDNHMMFFWQLLNLELWFRQLSATAAAAKDGTALEIR
jgi:asparagine synthase (glutamine-hydrolysing)